MRIAAVRVFVADLARSAAWFEALLGRPTAGGIDAGFVVFDAGVDLVVETVGDDSEIPAEELIGRFTGVSFGVDDIQLEVGRLVDGGSAVIGAPERQNWGGILATVADPDGNEFQLVQYP